MAMNSCAFALHKENYVLFCLAIFFQILKGCSHVLPLPPTTAPPFLPKRDKLCLMITVTSFPLLIQPSLTA